ncbi:MAG: glycoside hydrolase family 16 protein [Marmoricola sp.]|nr:glycoside hydrolase family 16 protein [Marmoricola sp.]
MPRTTLLAVAGIALLAAVLGGTGNDRTDLRLAADDPGSSVGSGEISVLDHPAQLELRQGGLVTIKASAPAEPGDRVHLNTAGAYNAGYVRVSSARLDRDLTATLRIPGRDFLGSYDYWATARGTSDHGELSGARFPIEIVSPARQRAPSCGGETPQKADGTSWVCTYNDEFAGPELDRRYWVPQETENSGFTTGTKFTYACAQDSPETIDVADGNLELSLVDRGETRYCGKTYSSPYAYGQVMHHQTFAQTYGKYEIRAKIPDLDVTGSQVSFWLWPQTDTYGPWPASGEIDIAEMYSSAPGIDKPFMHYLPGSGVGENVNVTHAACPIREGEYNTYGTEWEPGRVTMLLNGKVCMVNNYASLVAGDGSAAPFDHPFYLNLNQAMGTIGNEYDASQLPNRITTKVDYVRVWR